MIGLRPIVTAGTLSLWFVASSAMAATAGPASVPTVEQAQRWALRHAGLEPARVLEHLDRMRWAAAVPELRFRIVHDADRDGRTTVHLADARWMGDVAAVDRRGQGLRLQGELVWRPAELLGGRAELSALQEVRSAAAARQGLLEAVTRAWFARARARLAASEARQAGDGQGARDAEVEAEEQTALLDGLTGGLFSAERGR